MAELPSGTVTLLFSDVAGSTELVKRLGGGYASTLAAHRELLRTAVAEHSGIEVDTQGDSFFFVFQHARDAVAAAAAAQRAIAVHPWPNGARVSVRMGLHTGEPNRAEHGYAGLSVHRAARICTLARGGQVLLSRAAAGIVDDEQLPGLALRDLGEAGLKDFDRPERIYQLVIEGLPGAFPPLRAPELQAPLSGTITAVVVEGRRVMRLVRQLDAADFGALLTEYGHLLSDVLTRAGGTDVGVIADTATASFPTAGAAARAAVAAVGAVAAHDWPRDVPLEVSIGIHSGPAGVGWAGPALLHCSDLTDAAEAGQIFLSQTTAGLLEQENLAGLTVRDLGTLRTRRSGKPVRVYELLDAPQQQV